MSDKIISAIVGMMILGAPLAALAIMLGLPASLVTGLFAALVKLGVMAVIVAALLAPLVPLAQAFVEA